MKDKDRELEERRKATCSNCYRLTECAKQFNKKPSDKVCGLYPIQYLRVSKENKE